MLYMIAGSVVSIFLNVWFFYRWVTDRADTVIMTPESRIIISGTDKVMYIFI